MRKFISILFALVLALSFSLLPAMPAAAAEAEYTLITDGVGVAEWSADEYLTGSYSLKLFAPAATGDYGKVVMPLDMEFEDFADFSVWVEGGAEAQALPLHDIKAVVDNVAGVILPASNKGTGTDVDLQNKIVVLASQPGQSEALSPTLMSDGALGWEKYGTHDDATINVGSGAYWSIFVYSAAYVYEAAYDYYTWEQIHSVLDGKATVTEVRIELRYPQDPADVASTVYIDDITINDVTYELELPAGRPLTVDDDRVQCPTAYFQSIQSAVACAVASETVMVYAGTYDAETFPIDVNVANLTIESVSGADTTIIDSVDAGMVIAISAAGVTIGGTDKGFIIRGTGAGTNGVISIIGANDATITDNRFIGDYYLMVLGPGVSGAMVEDNVFLAYFAITANEVTGIYVNNDVTGSTFDGNSFPPGIDPIRCVDSGIYLATGTTADQTITISNNIFEGMGLRDSGTKGCAAIELAGVGGITIESNTIVNSNDGIWFQGEALTGDVTIQNNTIIGNAWGIEVKDGVGTVGTITANYNKIMGNTTNGLLNEETDVTVDAQYNWWGNAAGPNILTNPYDTYAGSINDVSANVDYIPWLIHTTLVANEWNIYSTPIALDSSCDTLAEALAVWGSSHVDAAWYYDSSGTTPHWAVASSLTPLQAIYLHTTAADTIDVWFGSSYTAPPSRVMYQGWNLVGPAELYQMYVNGALLSAYYGTSSTQTIDGYSQAISPAVNQTYWTYLRGEQSLPKNFVPTNGYWVYMVNQGTLGGFTSTPITEVTPQP